MSNQVENPNNAEDDGEELSVSPKTPSSDKDPEINDKISESDRIDAKAMLDKSSESLELDFEVDLNIKESGLQNIEGHLSDKEEKETNKEDLEEGEDGEISDEDEPEKSKEEGALEDKPKKDEEDEDDGELTDSDENSEKKDEGEISDDDDGLEDGELKDAAQPVDKPPTRQICRFFNRGRCTFGQVCRFLHLSYNSRGNYSMFPNSAPYQPPMNPPFIRETPRFMLNQETFFGPPPVAAIEPPTETPWEHELYATKELMEKHKYSNRSGPSFSPDFDEKGTENDKENKNYVRRRDRYENDSPYGHGDSNFKRNYNNFESGSNNGPSYRQSDRSRNFRGKNNPNEREKDKSRSFREKKRSRSRSGSYSDSDRSSQSSYSRSSSLSSWESSRSPSPHASERKSPIGSMLLPSKYDNPDVAKDKSERRSERNRSYARSYSRSDRSRSISMDSISDDSGSSSGSESDHEPRIPPVPNQDHLKFPPVQSKGVKRPLSPPSPEATLIPKKGIHSRRDDLLKQLKAVEDAIARKREKCS